MAEQVAPDEAALKERVMTHMNREHRSSLSHYLQHYSRLPASVSDTAQLADISLSRLTLSIRAPTGGTTTTYLPIRPSPMSTFSEARERLVYMANECLTGLGLSRHVVKTYSPPGIFGLTIMAIVITGLWAFSSQSHLAEGSFLRIHILQNYHPLADFLMRAHKIMFSIILAIHVAECVHLQRTRLRKHQVPMYSKIWWLWMVTCFFEGFGVFNRFDKTVDEVAKVYKKH